jgi:DNA adenine methylase
MSKPTLPLKTHGGKSYLADRILELMPPHRHYVEVFGGGLALLLARDRDDPKFWLGKDGNSRGVSELANDLDGRLMNFWRVLQNEETFPRFRRQVEAIPMSRPHWDEAHNHVYGADPVVDAVAFFVDTRQSLAGRRKGFTSITRTRLRRGMNGNASEWCGAIDGLAEVHARLRTVVLENMDAVKLIPREDDPGTLFYCDPPYPKSARVATKAYGDFEMSDAAHRQLLEVLKACRGKVVLSTYETAMYTTGLRDWNRREIKIANHASGGKAKRKMTEILFCNF